MESWTLQDVQFIQAFRLESMPRNMEQQQHHGIKLKKSVSRSTAKSMKKAYEEELRKRKCCDDGSSREISDLPAKKRDRKVLLGEDLNMKVQLYLRQGGWSHIYQDSSSTRNLVQINAG